VLAESVREVLGDEGAHGNDGEVPVDAEIEKMMIAGDQPLGMRRHGAVDELVVGRVGGDDRRESTCGSRSQTWLCSST